MQRAKNIQGSLEKRKTWGLTLSDIKICYEAIVMLWSEDR